MRKNIYCFTACLKDSVYKGTLIEENVQALTAIDCLKQCNRHKDCKFWDMHNGNCKLHSDEGYLGAIPGYQGALGGPKDCSLLQHDPNGIKYFT